MVDDLIEETHFRFNDTSVVISHSIAIWFRTAHNPYLLIKGEVAASGSPYDLAFGENAISRDFIAKSGIATENVDRIVDDVY